MGEAGYRLEATLPSPALDVRHGSGVLRCTVAVCDVELQHIFQFGPRRCAGAFDALQMWVAVSRAARYHAPDPTHATKKVNTNGLAITQRCKYGSSWHVAFTQFESIHSCNIFSPLSHQGQDGFLWDKDADRQSGMIPCDWRAVRQLKYGFSDFR